MVLWCVHQIKDRPHNLRNATIQQITSRTASEKRCQHRTPRTNGRTDWIKAGELYLSGHEPCRSGSNNVVRFHDYFALDKAKRSRGSEGIRAQSRIEIRQRTNPENWRHCPGVENPADYVSRGLTAKELGDKQEWWGGPEWLSQGQSNWPKDTIELDRTAIEQANQENMKSEIVMSVAVKTDPVKVSVFNIDPDRFSTYKRLIRVTAWINRLLTPRKYIVITADEQPCARWENDVGKEF